MCIFVKSNEKITQLTTWNLENLQMVINFTLLPKGYCCGSVYQASRLDSEVTRLRAQLEKGEAVRQNLEYELSKAKRDINKEKRNVSERDSLITEVNDTMKREYGRLPITDLSEDCKSSVLHWYIL